MPGTNTTSERERDGVEKDGPVVPTAVEMTESYETDDGVVFYDAENPLAWMQADHTVDLDSSA